MAGTTYERLVEAGAPALADPYFYRITPSTADENLLRVELRRGRALFGSDRVALGFVNMTAYKPESLLPVLVYRLKEIVEDGLRRESAEARFAGDFVPAAVSR